MVPTPDPASEEATDQLLERSEPMAALGFERKPLRRDLENRLERGSEAAATYVPCRPLQTTHRGRTRARRSPQPNGA
jgi:hypothetical protein